ncbi:MAG: hypothetical protein IJW63_05885 [Lachnospiraceae bacterium]|nr:hypothetical protein [Lachnospiraceae bacterium]
MKKSYWRINVVGLVLCGTISLVACGRENIVADTSVQTSVTEKTSETGNVVGDVEEDEKENTTSTEAEIVENYIDHYVEEIPWGDLDSNGVPEYLLIENDASYGSLSVYMNEELIYKHTEELSIVGVDAKEFIDLDNDGEKEIFVSFMPAVNSMPLEEWFALKKSENGWKLMEMHHNSGGMSDNGFPIFVTLQDGDFELAISCEGFDKKITFDATKYYEQMKNEQEVWGFPAYDSYMDSNFQVGDIVGYTSAYGIWNIEVGVYEDQKCLIAEHGLNGPTGKYDFYGCVYVYFAYDENAEIKILDLVFREAVGEGE